MLSCILGVVLVIALIVNSMTSLVDASVSENYW